jgi:hypothetical protein
MQSCPMLEPAVNQSPAALGLSGMRFQGKRARLTHLTRAPQVGHDCIHVREYTNVATFRLTRAGASLGGVVAANRRDGGS